jgi:transcriptional regulator with XRE-family HTH domain
MSLLDLAQQYEIERQTIRTLLDSALGARGAEKEIARRAGLTPIHLSYIRADKRMPSVAMAQRLAAALAWTEEQREGFVHHVAQMWRLKSSLARQVQPRAPGPSDEMVNLVRQAHSDATFARDSESAQILYRRARTMAELLLTVTDPSQAPLKFAELTFVAHDALCVLNRNDEALWHAQRARAIAVQLDPRSFPWDKERVDFIQVNALRCEAVALHNLHLPRHMQRACEEVEALAGLRRNENFWRPFLNRDKIQALTDTPRFSIRAVEDLARQAFNVCATRGDAVDPLLTLLVSQSLALAYLQYGNFDKAYRVLTRTYDDLDKIPHIGTLHRVIFFKTFARYYWLQGARGAEWRAFAEQAFQLATKAGLQHQRQELEREFGTALLKPEAPVSAHGGQRF